ncbi:multiple cyclophane-containing RiPP AmcA [Micromonospora sp. CPCC 205561]|uniref:multiple cyclophane-containing RiPP AmcA n=1 Tax=Micromonospora sp. CPCC 205561 TaxID=3122407 RepID=UPI002FF380CD
MPETTSHRQPDQRADAARDEVADRVRDAAPGLTALLHEAEAARGLRAEAGADGAGAVCAWNHFENIPTFYNWNNRPR